MTDAAETRALAARLLHLVVAEGRTVDQVLPEKIDDPLTTELLFGSLRHYFSLSACVNKALRQPVRSKDHDLWCLMIVGAYQRFHTRIPDHAALHSSVEAVRHLRKPWAKGLVNAVLRNLKGPEQSFEHPGWMQRLIEAAYGGDAAALMVANNERAPMALRINRAATDPEAFRTLLTGQGLAFRPPASPEPAGGIDSPPAPATDAAAGTAGPAPLGWGSETLILGRPVPVARLPGHAEGQVSVQDAGAQLAPALFTPTAGQRLLDACAAPGGKFFHLLERHPTLDATALDLSEARLDVLRAEGRRLGHRHFRAVAGDAAGLDWWDDTPYQHILLDAPCSGSGTLRRHPDIKILRQSADLPRYAALQHALLANLWRTLQPGGTLVYCTCSLFPTENDDVITGFLATHPDASVQPFRLASGRPTGYGWQLLPIDADTDGFYYARLRKAAP